MLRCHVINAVFKRNVLSYFSGVLGYLFIVVFVVAGSFLAFNPRFFTNNLATLDQLNETFPLLLLFIIPAITMSVWADEKKAGTDELLFTLPATDIEILAGKYLSVLTVYTVTLLFSLTHLCVLGWYANPDWGLLLATYVGYWMAGAALLSAGMFASVLTQSTTVAFVLGAVICSVPVFIDRIAPNSQWIRELSLREQFHEFGIGMVPLGAVLYFASFTVFMLYLNLVFIRRRHWSSGQQTNMGLQYAVRIAAMAVILVSLNTLAGYATFRVDMTAEKLFSVSPTTRELVGKIDRSRPITIQAFISPDVPREYVPVRKRLIGLLRQYDQLGGPRIDVRFVDVEPFSEQAEEAKYFGIQPVRVRTEREGRILEENVYLGAVVTSSYDEVVIPFFGPGTPIEYELTRSIHTVSNEERLTIGILRTDANVLSASAEWQMVTELKKQYDVTDVSPDSPIDQGKFDVLIAVLPSSLTQPQMAHLVEYVQSGKPTLIFDDPFPWFTDSGWGVSNAPRQPKPSPGGMMGGFNRQSPEQKADGGKATSLLNTLKIAWDNGQVVWDTFNPHPELFAVLQPEVVFVSPQSGTRTAFSPNSEITDGLQEVVVAFAGTIRPRADSDFHFEPLLRTGVNSGLLSWNEFVEEGFDPMRMQPAARPKREPIRSMDGDAHVIAAHITSEKDAKLNVVYVADIDLITDWSFQMRTRGESNIQLDNVTFVLNAVDVLAGDDSYLDLRKRRATLRTLTEVESQTAEFIKDRNKQQEKANQEAARQLELARERFQKQREEIQNDESLDAQTKQIMLRNIQATEERRLQVAEANIEREKREEIEQIKARTERKVRALENQIRMRAILLPPLPAIVLGIVVMSLRLYHEQRDIAPNRRVNR